MRRHIEGAAYRLGEKSHIFENGKSRCGIPWFKAVHRFYCPQKPETVRAHRRCQNCYRREHELAR